MHVSPSFSASANFPTEHSHVLWREMRASRSDREGMEPRGDKNGHPSLPHTLVISIFRWCETPMHRVAGFRVLKLRPGIGPSTAASVREEVEAQRGADVLASIQVPKATAQDWPGFAKLVARMRKDKTGWPTEFEFIRRWYEPHLQRMYDDAPLRAADIVQLEQIAAGYESRERFLTELTLDPPDATSGRARADSLDEDYTILSTI